MRAVALCLTAIAACGGGSAGDPGAGGDGPRAPTVGVPAVPAGLAAGTMASFSVEVTDPGHAIAAVSWSFGDGNSAIDSALQRSGDTARSVMVHTYGARGDYPVAASVTVAGTTVLASALASVSGPATGCAQHDFTVSTPDFYFAYAGYAGQDPRITICPGETFTFHLDNVSSMHPFCIWNQSSTTEAPGVTGNCTTGTADVVWQVPSALPDGARYICEVHYFGASFVVR